MITGLVNPVFPIGALIFFLYPFRKLIVPRRTMQLGIIAFLIWLFISLSGVLFPFIMAFIVAYLCSPLIGRLQNGGCHAGSHRSSSFWAFSGSMPPSASS